MAVADQAGMPFYGGLVRSKTVSCDQCHPNASTLHPEPCPRFQRQPGEVAVPGERINGCVMNPLESDPLPLDCADTIALQSCMRFVPCGLVREFGAH